MARLWGSATAPTTPSTGRGTTHDQLQSSIGSGSDVATGAAGVGAQAYVVLDYLPGVSNWPSQPYQYAMSFNVTSLTNITNGSITMDRQSAAGATIASQLALNGSWSGTGIKTASGVNGGGPVDANQTGRAAGDYLVCYINGVNTSSMSTSSMTVTVGSDVWVDSPFGLAAPATPGAPTATAGAGEILLSWSTVSTATAYDLYRDGSLYVSDITVLVHTDGATDTTTSSHSYKLVAKNAAGSSAQSTASSSVQASAATGGLTSLGLLGSLSSKASAGSLAVTNTTGTSIPSGTFIVVGYSADPANGTTVPTLSCSTIGGATAVAVNASAAGLASGTGAGVYMQMWYAKTTSSIASGATIATVTSNQAPVASAALAYGWTGMGTVTKNSSVQFANSSGVISTSTPETPVDTSHGDLVVAVFGVENSAVPTGDSDTTRGTWSTIVGVTTTGGSANTNMGMALQAKIVTDDGSQTYDLSTGQITLGYLVVFNMPPPSTAGAQVFAYPIRRTASTAVGRAYGW